MTEVDEGSNGSLDLGTVSKDATSFEFTPGYTAPGWLTISGMDLVITNAPDVSSDTDFEPQVRAIRDSKHEDKTLTVRVIAGSGTTAAVEPTDLYGTCSKTMRSTSAPMTPLTQRSFSQGIHALRSGRGIPRQVG